MAKDDDDEDKTPKTDAAGTPAHTGGLFDSLASEPRRRVRQSAGTGSRNKGSSNEIIPGRKKLKEYPLTESELENLEGSSDRAATRFAIGAFVAAFPVQWLWDYFVAKSITEKPSTEAVFLIILWAVIACAFFIFGILEKCSYETNLKKIKDSTVHPE